MSESDTERKQYCPECDEMVAIYRSDDPNKDPLCNECDEYCFHDKEEYIEVTHILARIERNREIVSDGGDCNDRSVGTDIEQSEGSL